MSIASDIQLATCDLSFEVSSDLSSRIFVWRKAKPDFSLPMQTPCEKKEHRYTQNLENLQCKLLGLILRTSFTEAILDLFAKESLFFLLCLLFLISIIGNPIHLFRNPY